MLTDAKSCPFCTKANSGYLVAIRTAPEGYKAVYCCGCGAEGPAANTDAEAIAAWNTRVEGDARDAARYRGIRHAMANSDEHFLELLEQHLSQRGLLDHKLLSETEIDSAFDAALKTSNGANHDN